MTRAKCLSADSQTGIAMALDLLRRGNLVAVATETVYGLAADATNGKAVAKIFEAKGRPRFNPLICHVSCLDMAERIGTIDDTGRALASAFWPGPLTMVVPRRREAKVHPLTTAGLTTVAVRAPRGVLGTLAAEFGRPLAAPSANRSGRVSPTTAAHVVRELGDRVELVLDGGPSTVGIESTIVEPMADRLVLLRAGAIDRAGLTAATGLAVVDPRSGAEISAPGQMRSHYAPFGRVRLDAAAVEAGEHVVAFGSVPMPGIERAAGVINISPSGNLMEAAVNLFAALAAFDAPLIEAIAVAPIPRTGIGEAINDRLARAAAPRD